MIGEGTRQLDLYDIVSIFIPGAALALGLLPFLPQQIEISSTAGIAVAIIISFIFGRGIAAIGIQIESRDRPTSHREYFGEQLRTPTTIDCHLADRFYTAARLHFGLHELPATRVKLDKQKHESAISSLYSHIRSFIHIDARGRSRTFQAVLDFCRGMLVTSAILAIVYIGYAIALLEEINQSDLVPYETKIGTYALDPLIVIIFGAAVFAACYLVFEGIRSNYREYYIQYLMIDFLVLLQND